jgi:hypothetical protein
MKDKLRGCCKKISLIIMFKNKLHKQDILVVYNSGCHLSKMLCDKLKTNFINSCRNRVYFVRPHMFKIFRKCKQT